MNNEKEFDYQNFLDYFRKHLEGKKYCKKVKEISEYHYETVPRETKGLGVRTCDKVKVADSYKEVLERTIITSENVIRVLEGVTNGDGWIEN